MNEKEKIQNRVDKLRGDSSFNMKMGIQTMYFSTALILSGIGERFGKEYEKYKAISNFIESYSERYGTRLDSINYDKDKPWRFYDTLPEDLKEVVK